ncbi:hypothetical protein [Methylobacter sp. BlB1]|uniref:hypothetical protein n=1 Tax=Methylobacter sp. BlB1 TaxID=2785914 RepID=UPI001894D764|nr:hypothetical protein [Methylobacter sp. BlB1]MBF6650951.1 hypothetical protein [Methylobacter sp. BlB1]
MSFSQTKIEIEELLENHANGLYTSGEVVSIVIGLFNESNIDELWGTLPDWLKKNICSLLADFSEIDELVSFGRGDPELIRKQSLFVRNWLSRNSYI